VDKALKEKVYNDTEAWKKFLKILTISLGTGFTVSGIIFFFAYNWANLNKFAKIGIVEVLLIAATIMAVFPKIKEPVKNTILTAASVLVGVLFAIYGQIYQTGANAYDFFLVWTIFVSIWVLVSNFAPLWLLYLVLINTTIILYSQQVAKDWSEVFICSLLFIINLAFLCASLVLKKKNIPNWFLYIIALAAASFATIGMVIGIFDKHQPSFLILGALVAIVYGLGIWYGLKTKSGFYLAVIPFSIIIIISALLINTADTEQMFLIISLFIIISVTLTIRNLINLQKKWNHEK